MEQPLREVVTGPALLLCIVHVALFSACAGADKGKADDGAGKIKRFELPEPGASDRGLYTSGCAWMTLDGDAVVCFETASGEGGEARMTVLGVQTPHKKAEKSGFSLWAVGSEKPGKGKDFAAARAWLDSHPIITVDARGRVPMAVLDEGARVVVVVDGKRWDSGALTAQQAKARASMGPVLELTTGKLVAVIGAGATPSLVVFKPWIGALPEGVKFVMPTSDTKTSAAPQNPTNRAALKQPGKATLKAPAQFRVRFETTAGVFEVMLTRSWAPKGVDRFYNLVQAGFFEDVAIFRAIAGFMFQFGIHGDPEVSAAWQDANIEDDPVQATVASNVPGTLTYAMAGPGTRTTQLFVNLGNNARLDGMGFAPIGRVVAGLEVLQAVNTEYGEGAPRGKGPNQALVQSYGNAYLRRKFPRLTWIKTAQVLQ